jgi:NTE family protein
VESSLQRPEVALCLPGGGAPGVMFQIAALAALEHCLEGFEGANCHSYVGTSSGASVAAALAAGKDVQRIYRALLDPADDYFPLERKHVLRTDLGEWRRTFETAVRALGHGSRSLWTRSVAPTPKVLWEELARLYDSLPAGLFSLDGYERFLEENFLRRDVPNQFGRLARPLRIIACDLDTGHPVVFGEPGLAAVPITRACVASMATPPLFTPVRIGDHHYINPGPSPLSHVEVAMNLGARVILVINPLVPLRAQTVPTGHGTGSSIRDKGAMWVANQAHRIKLHALLWRSIESARSSGAAVVVIEPEASDGTLFMHNPASFAARRAILEYSFLYTCDLISKLLASNQLPLAQAGWRKRTVAA